MELNFTLDEIGVAASRFIAVAGAKRVVALHGEMGAGKTTFVNAVCDQLGVTDAVSSPTFSIINQYMIAGGQKVYHIDLYRLKDEDEAVQAGVEDCLFSGSWCFVEWPEKAPGLFTEDILHVSLTTAGINSRKLTINL